MKERPILFSAPMVRALLAGTKTQTRRVIKPQPTHFNPAGVPRLANPVSGPAKVLACPFGQPGDRLWVREGHALDGRRVFYRSGHGEEEGSGPRVDVRWRPSIHMPRWASRITLEVTSVRVERLQDISEADALAEGVDAGVVASFARTAGVTRPAGFAYRDLWESINGPGSWDANPLVWVVEFKRVEGGAP